jgi:hypothetical protein
MNERERGAMSPELLPECEGGDNASQRPARLGEVQDGETYGGGDEMSFQAAPPVTSFRTAGTRVAIAMTAIMVRAEVRTSLIFMVLALGV